MRKKRQAAWAKQEPLMREIKAAGKTLRRRNAR